MQFRVEVPLVERAYFRYGRVVFKLRDIADEYHRARRSAFVKGAVTAEDVVKI